MKKEKSTKKFEKDQKKGHKKDIEPKDLKKTSGGRFDHVVPGDDIWIS